MLASISPLGERARGNRWGLTATAYLAGSMAGGAVTGALLGALGAIVGLHGSDPVAALGVLALTAAVVDALLRGRLPGPRRQVDEDWLIRYRGWVYGAGFGFQLGAGVTTIVTTATVYAWLAAVAWSGSILTGAIVGAVFGATRALPLAAVAGVKGAADLRRRLRRISDLSGTARWAAVAVSSTIAIGCLAMGVRA